MSDTEAKRTRIKSKIAASQARLNRDAPPSPQRKVTPLPDAYPPDRLSTLAGEYPLLTIAGGIATGVLIAALLPRSIGRKLSRRTVALATIAGELGLTYGKQALDAANEAGRDARGKVGEWGDAIDDGTADARKRAARTARDAAGTARSAGLSLARNAVRLAAKARRSA